MGLIYPRAAYTLAQATAMVRQLLPRGPVWETAGADDLAEALAGWALRASLRIVNLVDEFFGSSASETIEAWGREYGLLDDACSPWPAVLADQQAAVRAAEVAQGGQTVAYFVAVAAALGIVITITEAPGGPPRWGDFVWGDGSAYASDDAAHEWLVTGPAATDAALQDRLECLFGRLRPAHTIVNYSWSA